jgi:hypothetical protein
MSTALSLTDATLRNIKAQGFFRGIAMMITGSTAAGSRELAWGTGAPNHTAAQGSAFIRLDAPTSGNLFYRNTDGAATWESAIGTDDSVKATIAVADATGGATTAALTLAVTQRDGITAISSARQVYISCSTTQYRGNQSGSATFGTATVGSIIASGTAWMLVRTNSVGAFACTVTDTVDETLYFSAMNHSGGVSDLTQACTILGSNSDPATWSA